jgi:5-dehydro-2-deoxygluconokinase
VASDGPTDLVCFGRCCVDLYGEQLGAPLSAVESFSMYVGGSAANICVGSARLGLRTAMLTRVGDEELGRFVIATFAGEGVDTSHVQLDPERPTGVVTLAVRERDGFPRLFLYRDSPDMAVDPELVDVAAVARARALLLTGTMLARSELAALSSHLASEVRRAGGRVVLDADFRPVLWGLVPIGRGNVMAAQSPAVTQAYQRLLPWCDLVVGTEEEVRAIGGSDELGEALRVIRGLCDATIVVKSGAFGAAAHPPGAPLGDGVRVPGFSVEVLNTVGAGDGFMSAFLSRWVCDASLEECLRAGNAGGAIVATRHGCMAAMPFAAELEDFLARKGVARPSQDPTMERLHRVGARRPTPSQLFVLAMDHRWQLEAIADEAGAAHDRLRSLKRLLADAFVAVAGGRDDCGILVDEQYGAAVLEQMAGSGIWTARSMDVARSRPVELLAGEEAEAVLQRWPVDHVAKVMCYAHPADPDDLMQQQLGVLGRLARACRGARRELLVELQAPAGTAYGCGELVALVERCYRAGICPEWWKLPALADPELWRELEVVLRREDPSCRGVLVLGSVATPDELREVFPFIAGSSAVHGFAIGRAIFSEPARRWLAGEIADAEVVETVAAGYRAMIAAWSEARQLAPAP